MKSTVIFVLLILIFSGCGGEENSPPMIHLFEANPTSVEAGDEVTLTVLATDDDGDNLSYIYQPGTGKITGTGDTVKWTAPNTPGKYSIKVNVSDGKEYAYNDVNITVIEQKEQEPTKGGIIVPGEQALGIRIGDSIAKIESLYGKGVAEVSGDFLFYTYLESGITFTIDESNRVESIFIFQPNTSKTAGGNGVGSTLVSVEKELGKPEEIDESSRRWYWTKGIEIDYDESSRVLMMFIFSQSIQAPSKVRFAKNVL